MTAAAAAKKKEEEESAASRRAAAAEASAAASSAVVSWDEWVEVTSRSRHLTIADISALKMRQTVEILCLDRNFGDYISSFVSLQRSIRRKRRWRQQNEIMSRRSRVVARKSTPPEPLIPFGRRFDSLPYEEGDWWILDGDEDSDRDCRSTSGNNLLVDLRHVVEQTSAIVIRYTHIHGLAGLAKCVDAAGDDEEEWFPNEEDPIFEFHVEYAADCFYPLHAGELGGEARPGHQAAEEGGGGEAAGGCSSEERTGGRKEEGDDENDGVSPPSNLVGKKWSDFPSDARVGWRGPCILLSDLAGLPTIVKFG